MGVRGVIAGYFFARRGTQALLTAIDEYGADVARDSAIARAWAGMAMGGPTSCACGPRSRRCAVCGAIASS